MLVYVEVSYKLKGYTKLKPNAFHKKLVREHISLRTGNCIVCDEADINDEINRAIEEKMKNSKGWGTDFEGWTEWEYTSPVKVQKIKDMPMRRIIDLLTGEQFRRFMNE